MKECISREAALAALKTYNKEAFYILHGLTVEGVMRWYANGLGYGEDADFWATVGLLHDIDFEMWPEQHCRKAPELLKKAGCSVTVTPCRFAAARTSSEGAIMVMRFLKPSSRARIIKHSLSPPAGALFPAPFRQRTG